VLIPVLVRQLKEKVLICKYLKTTLAEINISNISIPSSNFIIAIVKILRQASRRSLIMKRK
jgi:hypothetical protein